MSWYYAKPTTANIHDTVGNESKQETNNDMSNQVSSPNTPNTTTIDVIPDDIWKSICYFLDYKDFFIINQSCHFFHSLLIKGSPSLNKFWYYQCNNIFYRMEKNYKCKNWYKFFIEMKRLYSVLSIPMESLSKKSKKFRVKMFRHLRTIDILNECCHWDCPTILDMILSNERNHFKQNTSDYYDYSTWERFRNPFIGGGALPRDRACLDLWSTDTSDSDGEQHGSDIDDDEDDYVDYVDYDENKKDLVDIDGSKPNILENGEILGTACKYGSINCVKYLIKNYSENIDMDNIDTIHNPLSALAMSMNHKFSIAKLLITNHRGLLDKTKRKDIINQLIDNAISTFYSNGSHKRTLLHFACSKNDVELVKWLLDKGSNMNIVDSNCATPFYIACENKNWDVMRVLMEYAMKPEIDIGIDLLIYVLRGRKSIYSEYVSETIIFWASKNNRSDILYWILKNGVELKMFDVKKGEHTNLADTTNFVKITPLCMALYNGCDDAVRCLLFGYNVNPNQVSKFDVKY